MIIFPRTKIQKKKSQVIKSLASSLGPRVLWWPYVVVGVALALALLLFLWWRRRRARHMVAWAKAKQRAGVDPRKPDSHIGPDCMVKNGIIVYYIWRFLQ